MQDNRFYLKNSGSVVEIFHSYQFPDKSIYMNKKIEFWVTLSSLTVDNGKS